MDQSKTAATESDVEIVAQRARKLAKGTDVAEYREALADLGRVYLSAYPSKGPHWQQLAMRLVQWLPSMSYNNSYFGEPSGFLKQTVNELKHQLPRGGLETAAGAPFAPALDRQSTWSLLALQFDRQRMAAMAHLRTLLAHPETHAETVRKFLAASPAEQMASHSQQLFVSYGAMPESNGKMNWTAMLHRGDPSYGYTIDRSEYPDRVRYSADYVRWLIGSSAERPNILDYDCTLHSGYVEPTPEATPQKGKDDPLALSVKQVTEWIEDNRRRLRGGSNE